MPGKTFFTLLQYYLATVVDKCWNQFTTWKFFLKTTLDVEPTAIRYCASCLNLSNHGNCKMLHCSGKGVHTFLKEFFKDSEFRKFIRKEEEQMKNYLGRKIPDIYHGLDYFNFPLPGGFLTGTFNISFAVNSDGLYILWLMNFLRNTASKEIHHTSMYILRQTWSKYGNINIP